MFYAIFYPIALRRDLNQKATEGIRTHDLAFTKRLLYRLSYGGAGEIIQYRSRFDKRN